MTADDEDNDDNSMHIIGYAQFKCTDLSVGAGTARISPAKAPNI